MMASFPTCGSVYVLPPPQRIILFITICAVVHTFLQRSIGYSKNACIVFSVKLSMFSEDFLYCSDCIERKSVRSLMFASVEFDGYRTKSIAQPRAAISSSVVMNWTFLFAFLCDGALPIWTLTLLRTHAGHFSSIAGKR